MKLKKGILLIFITIFLVFLIKLVGDIVPKNTPKTTMLTAPFLQLPTPTSVYVVWFTEFPGEENYVLYGEKLDNRVSAKTKQLTKVAEDDKSHWRQTPTQPTKREIWRHQALISGLKPNQRLPYRVVSQDSQEKITSEVYSLAPLPPANSGVKILLTSDHQLMPLTAANIEKVAATVPALDGIFLAGDLVNIPDRASEWFDDQRGNAFFPVLQGKGAYALTKEEVTTTYRGAALIQNIPLFPTIGNHEVMGRYSESLGLNQQFDNSFPRQQATKEYEKIAAQINPVDDIEVKENWIKNHSFNVDSYLEIFTLPEPQEYYTVRFGNVWLASLYVTNMWRSPNLSPEVRGRYQERRDDLETPENWGYGQHIFGDITPGSEQYRWLKTQLDTEAFQTAKYKIVMFHHPPHTLGGNIVPPYTKPIQQKEYNYSGELQAITYQYPQAEDYIVKDLLPLLVSAKVDLVFYGHSHLWNRFYDPDAKIHFLESSNVGNSYGAHWGNSKSRPPEDYLSGSAAKGNPNGLEPIVPTIAPLKDEFGVSLPYVASNDLTVFSILDTNNGTVSSYRFDTRKPDSEVIKFDEFVIGERPN